MWYYNLFDCVNHLSMANMQNHKKNQEGGKCIFIALYTLYQSGGNKIAEIQNYILSLDMFACFLWDINSTCSEH